ncbi:Rieske 2Fe-2S domain-containing protein [Pedobacter sp. HDW13]|uniref:QcrA and Rieske domain-containing protein n=1 Tax=unclassified Pedobacter TaxID=2628915 RepID=UPI000F5B7DFB|nr:MULTISPECIES: Rieske 2Fe-2S domain-containing protein [unclassified Pedobacter]QIL39010.1 Rieske 2Fe-2S domain-containing protein [Pedobacter sp. HDW13]RQO72650.1 Rieske [Pedobacter sp. KBW01]
MERNEFIKSLGLGVAMVCTGACFSACGKKSDSPEPSKPNGGGVPPGTTASVDLTTQLLTVGASLVVSGILFIRTASGNASTSFVATQAACPHQGGALSFIQASNYIQCALHSSRYTTTGSILAQPNDGGTTSALKVYALTVSGNTLSATA